VIDRIVAGITPRMYRTCLRVFATLAAVGALAACGSSDDGGDGTPTGPGGGGGGAAAVAGTSSSTGGSLPITSAGTGGSSSGGTSSVPQGGMTSSAGTGNPAAGTSSAGGVSSTGGAASTEFWIAPDGVDANPGTEALPFKTLQAGLTKAKPGVTLWLKPGTYPSAITLTISNRYNGTQAMPITLKAASGARPVLDFSSQARGQDGLRGINLEGDFWRIEGIELTKASDNCIAISGSNNTIEDVITHECGDSGIQITAPSAQATENTRAANNTILNCDSWGNLDTATGGENADGFAAKLRIGPGNSFKGCRAWNNADDGWDLFAADDVVKIDSSWAFSNGKPIGGSNPQGDGNGFKLGGEPNGAGQGGAVHLVTNSFGFENKACGFVRNNNPDVPKLTACGAKDNDKDPYCNLTVSGEVSMSMTASAAISAKRNADGSLPAMK
jgi:pectate disaccharide-lyase